MTISKTGLALFLVLFLVTSALGTVDNVNPTSITQDVTVAEAASNTTITSHPPALSNSDSASFTFTSTESGTFECQLDTSGYSVCTTPRPYSDLTDGSHTFYVRTISDPAPATYTWTVDTSAPNTIITSYPPALSNSDSATFTFTSTESGTFECQLDTSGYSVCTTPQPYSVLTDGSHTFYVRAKDGAGNTDPTPATYTWTVDTIAPNTIITSYPPALSNSDSASFTFTSTESGTFECQLDTSGYSVCTTPRPYSVLTDGSHTFYVRAKDGAGNTDPTPATYTWMVDTTAPNTTITSFPPALTNSDGASFTFTSTESGTFECQLDTSGYSVCTTPQLYSGLTDGSHTFYVRAKDGAGNTDLTPANYTWTVDTSAPNTTITSYPPVLSNSSSATFTFISTRPGTFQCKLDTSGYSVCTTPQPYSGLTDGSHTFYVRAKDGAGNTDPTPANYTWTVDTIAPNTTITSYPPALSNSSNATFTFSSTESGTFECQLDTSGYSLCTTPQPYSGLTDGSHIFYVKAIDDASNIDPTPANYTWTVDTSAPNTTITSYPPALSNSSGATFTFISTKPGTFQCQLDTSGYSICTTPQPYSGLTDGSHTFYVQAIDDSNNIDLLQPIIHGQ